jgi:hypothetical protein
MNWHRLCSEDSRGKRSEQNKYEKGIEMGWLAAEDIGDMLPR